MGLDMYLQARRYLWASEHHQDDDAPILIEAADKLGFPKERENGYSLSVDIGYWRKANQIHQWFVDNCAGGEDDCKPVYVSREQLQELRDTCNEVLVAKSKDLAELKLPTSSGFFFGSTEYDKFYWDDLAETIETLDRALALEPGKFEIVYRASW
jgi:hypothetical protein